MMLTGLKFLGCERQDSVIIGDLMDTDIIAGIESGIDTILVLSGVSSLATIGELPYRRVYVLNTVGEVITRSEGDSGLAI